MQFFQGFFISSFVTFVGCASVRPSISAISAPRVPASLAARSPESLEGALAVPGADPVASRAAVDGASADLARRLPAWVSLRGAALIENIRAALGNTCQVTALERNGVVDPYHWRIQCAADTFFRSGRWELASDPGEVRCPLETGAEALAPWTCVGRLVAEALEGGGASDRPTGVDLLVVGSVDRERVDPARAAGGVVDACPEERDEAGVTERWEAFTREEAESEANNPEGPLHVRANWRLSFCRAARTGLTVQAALGAAAARSRVGMMGAGTRWFDAHPEECRSAECRDSRRIDVDLRFTMDVARGGSGCASENRDDSGAVLACYERNSLEHGAMFTQRVPQTGAYPVFVAGAPDGESIVHAMRLGSGLTADPAVVADMLR